MTTMLISFFACTIFVFSYAMYKNSKIAKNTSDGYFLGGRSLTSGVIAASILLANLSATHFVGMTGDVYNGNMSTIGWEINGALCLSIVAIFLLPRYLKGGITTIPDFLEDRYSFGMKQFITYLVIFAYIINMLPITLYAGSVVMNAIFGIDSLLGVSYFTAIMIGVFAVGIIGILYALFGGLKAAATADSINGVLLVIGGLLVPIFGFIALGNGDFMAGVEALSFNPEKMNSIGAANDLLPFSTTFTGLGIIVLYFFGTDQAMIQRALGAKDLKAGQKGIIFAGVYKILTPIVLMVPGLIAFQMYGSAAESGLSADVIYPTLVNDVLPKPLLGLFVAAMFGAILSTFNGLLNSISTLYAKNIYQPKHPNMSDKEIVIAGKKLGVAVAFISMIISPFLMYAPSGLYTHLQSINGFTNVPIIVVVFMGYANKKVPAFAARNASIYCLVVYGIDYLVGTPWHYLHTVAFLFVTSCLYMWHVSKTNPRTEDFVLKNSFAVDIKPWDRRYEFSGFLITVMVWVYIILSPVGLARVGGFGTDTMIYMVAGAIVVTILTVLAKKYIKPKEEAFLVEGLKED
ncbi:MAG: solute:sodium symporter family transporter [Epulopiscium sp. Nuni2H_MBin003]|nr:MAG: solute:sodium symporter family transporter [Epulopiscium sp. Nuni2H_MBin003]